MTFRGIWKLAPNFVFGGAFSGFGVQLFGNWRFRAKRRFRARVDPLAFSRFWAFLENFEGAGGLEPPLSPLLQVILKADFILKAYFYLLAFPDLQVPGYL